MQIDELSFDDVVAIKQAGTLVFRDRADSDSVMARAAFKMKLFPSYMWNAHQAIEKFLKSILVLNICTSRGLGHNLNKAVQRLQSYARLNFRIPIEQVVHLTCGLRGQLEPICLEVRNGDGSVNHHAGVFCAFAGGPDGPHVIDELAISEVVGLQIDPNMVRICFCAPFSGEAKC